MHRSQPVQRSASTVCISFGAPTMASTGQAWMHLVQPMHTSGSIHARCDGGEAPQAGSSARIGRPSTAASAAMTASPPGGQRLMSHSPAASACAYGWQAA